jgi:hypothetical protein
MLDAALISALLLNDSFLKTILLDLIKVSKLGKLLLRLLLDFSDFSVS